MCGQEARAVTPVCLQVTCRRSADGPCRGRGPTLAGRSVGGIGRESGIPQGGKSGTKAVLAPSRLGPRSCLAAAPRQAVAGRMPSTLPRQQDLPPPGTGEPRVSTAARHALRGRAFGGPLPPGWEKGRREKLPPQPGRELVLQRGPGWRRKTRGACSHTLHARGNAAFCCGFFAERDPQSLSVFEAWHTEQLGKTGVHLHLPSAGVWEDGGNKRHRREACGDLPSVRNKEETGETEQRDVAVC